jgi:probable addiction module antidote protein
MAGKPRFDPVMKDFVRLLADPDTAAGYLSACLDDTNPSSFLTGLRDVVQSRGGFVTASRATGLNRESLYRALSSTGNPSIRTLQSVLRASGLRLAIVPDKAKP